MVQEGPAILKSRSGSNERNEVLFWHTGGALGVFARGEEMSQYFESVKRLKVVGGGKKWRGGRFINEFYLKVLVGVDDPSALGSMGNNAAVLVELNRYAEGLILQINSTLYNHSVVHCFLFLSLRFVFNHGHE